MTRRSTVHQLPPLTRRRRPRPAGRAPGRPDRPATCRRRGRRSAAARPGRGIGAERFEHVGADLEAARPDAGAEPGATSPGAHPPPRRPRATRPRRRRRPGRASRRGRRHGAPAGAANSTGRQSAACTVQATPGSVVTLASASAPARPRRRRRRRLRPPGVPCTWRSQTGAAPNAAANARGWRRPLRVVADGVAEVHRGVGARLTPPSRVVISAPTPALRQAGASQLGRDGSRRVRAGRGLSRANAGSAMQASKTRITVGT